MTGASEWARARLGEVADDLVVVVPAAVRQAHEYAVAAQAAGGTQKKDPYGHTLKNTQHECLVDACRDLPGATTFRPKGASFELVRFRDARVLLYPWRYASLAGARRTARMRTSGFRQSLLTSDAPPRQLTLDEHAHLSQEELDLQLAEEVEILDQLRSLARVVTIGYASNPHALLELGWGDAELVDDRGTVDWPHWEDLPLLGAATAVTGLRRPAASELGRPPRFDDVPVEDDDFGLRPRHPLTGEPDHDGPSLRTGTGTDGTDRSDGSDDTGDRA